LPAPGPSGEECSSPCATCTSAAGGNAKA
jgi:hypothetical protein